MNTSFYHNLSTASSQSSSYQPHYNMNFQNNQSAYFNDNSLFNTSCPNNQTNFFDNKLTCNTYFSTNGLNFSNNKPLFNTNNTVSNVGFTTQGMFNPFDKQSNELAMPIEKRSEFSNYKKNQIKMDEEDLGIDIEDEPKSLMSLLFVKKNHFNR